MSRYFGFMRLFHNFIDVSIVACHVVASPEHTTSDAWLILFTSIPFLTEWSWPRSDSSIFHSRRRKISYERLKSRLGILCPAICSADNQTKLCTLWDSFWSTRFSIHFISHRDYTEWIVSFKEAICTLGLLTLQWEILIFDGPRTHRVIPILLTVGQS